MPLLKILKQCVVAAQEDKPGDKLLAHILSRSGFETARCIRRMPFYPVLELAG
jgi:hypothetical protein